MQPPFIKCSLCFIFIGVLVILVFVLFRKSIVVFVLFSLCVVLRDSLGYSILIGTSINNMAEIWAVRYSLNMANNMAEIWAVRYSLNMAWEFGFKYINLDIDSELVISQLSTCGVMAPEIAILICDCRTYSLENGPSFLIITYTMKRMESQMD